MYYYASAIHNYFYEMLYLLLNEVYHRKLKCGAIRSGIEIKRKKDNVYMEGIMI